MGIIYARVGDYLLPNLILSEVIDAKPLDGWGMVRKRFLKEKYPALYGQMLCEERLYPHCREVQSLAGEYFNVLVGCLQIGNPPPSKADDGLAWATHMQMLDGIAKEIVLSEIIYKNSYE